MENKNSLFEALALAAAEKAKEYALPLTASFVFGFLTHMYAFTNKLVNADEISALFTKGATVTSGRWGLELTGYLLPDYSMPWIFGLISVALLAVSVCLIISIFSVKSPLLQLGLSGCVMSFPALVGNFSFMFTSASYALAILAAVASVWFFERRGKLNAVIAVLLLSFSLGVYQAYISIASSFFVLLMFSRLMDEDSSAKEVFRRGVSYVLMLLVTLGIYYVLTFAVEHFAGSGYQEYEVMAKDGLLKSLLLAYTSFVRIVISGYFGYVNSTLSVAAHIVCGLVVFLALGYLVPPKKDKAKTLLAVALVAVYPLSVNCIYLIASVDIIHSLVLFGFISLYVFAAMAAGKLQQHGLLRDAAALSLAVILISNVFFANRIYLKMHLQYENAFAFYNTLMAQVMETPGFNSDTVVDFVGNEAGGIKVFDEIDSSHLTGPNDELVNIYTRVDFIRYYLGLDLYAYMEDVILNSDWYKAMPSYPDEGSIVMRPEENRIIVKFS